MENIHVHPSSLSVFRRGIYTGSWEGSSSVRPPGPQAPFQYPELPVRSPVQAGITAFLHLSLGWMRPPSWFIAAALQTPVLPSAEGCSQTGKGTLT